MSTSLVMNQPRPSSTSPIELQYNLHRLVEHNTTDSLQRPVYGPDGEMYLPSTVADGMFVSTAGMHQGVTTLPVDAYGDPFFGNLQYPPLHGAQALGIQYGSYEIPSTAHYGQESSIPRNMSFTSPNNRDATPATPQSATSISTRQSKKGAKRASAAIQKNINKFSKPSGPRLSRQKSKGAKAPRIDEPLSELTKDLTDVPVRDMEAWVNRPKEDRQKEVERKNGYVSRPMNSFMLYRSAYSERTKAWCVQNNHQVVSAVSGESWPLEPPEIREKYNELAKIERDNHAKAHPNYKFSPSKGGVARKKKEQFSDEEDSEHSDIADNDSEWKPRSERSKSARTKKCQTREQSQLLSDSPLHNTYTDPYAEAYNGFTVSTWDTSNQVKPLPGFMEQTEPYSQYYDATAYPLLTGPNIDGGQIHPMPLIAPQYAGMPNGLPGMYHSDLLELRSQQHTPVTYEPDIDPILTHFEPQSSHFDEDANLFGDNYVDAPSTSQFDDWMEAEDQT